MKTVRKSFQSLFLLAFLGLGTATSGYAATDPVHGGGPFGIGVEFGYPGNWGIVGNLWLTYKDSLQPAVKFDDGGASILQLDYLWHNYHIFHVHSGELPFYIGLGGDITLTDPAVVGARLPIGLSYIFGHETPLDIYAQVVPTIWFFPDRTHFDLYGNVGIRIYP